MTLNYNKQQDTESKHDFFTRRENVSNISRILNDFFTILGGATRTTEYGFVWILKDAKCIEADAEVILDLSEDKPEIKVNAGDDFGNIGYPQVYTIMGYCKWNEIGININIEQ